MFQNASIDELPVLLDRISDSAPDLLRDGNDWLDDEIRPLETSFDTAWVVQPVQKPIPTRQCLQTLKFDHSVRRILISSHQETLFTVGSPTRNSSPETTNTIQAWNWQTGNRVLSFKGHTAPIRTIALSQDGNTLVSGSDDRTIKVWNALTGEEVMTLEDHTSPVTAIALSPDGEILVSSGCNQYEIRDRQLKILNRDRVLRIWNLSEGKVTHTLPCITDVPMLMMGTSGKVLLKYEQQLEAVNVETGRTIPRLNGLKDCEEILVIASDWERAATIVDRQVRIRQFTTGEVLSRISLDLYDRSIQVCALSPDGKWFAAGFERTEIHPRHNSYLTRQNVLRIWDVRTGKQVACLDESALGQGMWQSIEFSSQGLLITSVGDTLKVWQI